MNNFADFILIYIMPVVLGFVIYFILKIRRDIKARKAHLIEVIKYRDYMTEALDPLGWTRAYNKKPWPEYSLINLGVHIARATGRRRL